VPSEIKKEIPRPGISKLFRRLYVDQRYLTEDDIGFVLGPRINAASRIDHPIKAFHFLSTRDEIVADELVDYLNNLNNRRKGLVASVVKEAKRKITENGLRDVMVLGNPTWQPGILGLAANTLMNEYKRPVFLWGRGEGETIKGSCRSNGSINVVQCMAEARDLFLDFGGHECAGGFSVHGEKIHFLEDALLEAYTKIQKKDVTHGDVVIRFHLMT